MKKPIASLSLDLDNKWSYMKTHRDAGWQTYPSYLNVVVPRVLQFLADRDLTITFFLVGRDAAIPANSEYLRSICDSGHEVGNHSFEHEPWLHLYSREQLVDDITRAEEQIQQVTGQRPVGFRGPGYSTSDEVIRVLTSRGYLYDASILPTFIGPLARTYYFLTSSFDTAERERRKALFGKLRDGLLPLAPYPVSCDHKTSLRFPSPLCRFSVFPST
jgi:peptidoglycan/xylan/chitin deacetylase (PgdA/CDA1 family)